MVLDFTTPESRRCTEALQAPGVRALLVRYGIMLAGSVAAAEDLLSDALIVACDAEDGKPWDPARGSFGAHMRMLMLDTHRRNLKRARARREVLDGELAHSEAHADPGLPPDEALMAAWEGHRLQELGERLRQRLVEDPQALAVFELLARGLTSAADIAAQLGEPRRSPRDVYDARRRINRAAARVLADARREEQGALLGAGQDPENAPTRENSETPEDPE